MVSHSSHPSNTSADAGASATDFQCRHLPYNRPSDANTYNPPCHPHGTTMPCALNAQRALHMDTKRTALRTDTARPEGAPLARGALLRWPFKRRHAGIHGVASPSAQLSCLAGSGHCQPCPPQQMGPIFRVQARFYGLCDTVHRSGRVCVWRCPAANISPMPAPLVVSDGKNPSEARNMM